MILLYLALVQWSHWSATENIIWHMLSLLLDTCLCFLHGSKWNDCSCAPAEFCSFFISGNLGWLHWYLLGDPNSTIISEPNLPPHCLVLNHSLKLLSALENIMRQLLGYCKFGTQHSPKSRTVKEVLKDPTKTGIPQRNGIAHTHYNLWSLSRSLKITMLLLDCRTISSSLSMWISAAKVTTRHLMDQVWRLSTLLMSTVFAICSNLLIFRLHFFGIRLYLFFDLDSPSASLMFTTRYLYAADAWDEMFSQPSFF